MSNASRLIIAVLALGLGNAALAEDYRVELGAQYLDWDTLGDAYGGDVTIHFEPVDTSRGPLGEASFLGRSSNLAVSYINFDDVDLDLYGAQLEFYSDQFYVAGAYSGLSNGADLDTYSVRVGYLPTADSRVTLGYEQVDPEFGGNVDIFSIGGKRVMALEGDTALNLEGEVGYADGPGDSAVAWAFALDYYPSRAFSIGGRASGLDSDEALGLGARVFFHPRVSLGVEYEREDGDDLLEVRLAARF